MGREEDTKKAFGGFIASLILFVVLTAGFPGSVPIQIIAWSIMMFMFALVLINFIVMKKTQSKLKSKKTPLLDRRY